MVGLDYSVYPDFFAELDAMLQVKLMMAPLVDE